MWRKSGGWSVKKRKNSLLRFGPLVTSAEFSGPCLGVEERQRSHLYGENLSEIGE